MQRTFGKFLPRTADESQVAVLLKEFDDADKMLSKVGQQSLHYLGNWDLLIEGLFTTASRCHQSLARLLERYIHYSAPPRG